MFVDYLRLSFKVYNGDHDPAKGEARASQCLAQHAVHAREARLLVTGENVPWRLDGAHRTSVQHDPDGPRIVMDWGGSEIPVDLVDFAKRFRKYHGWTVGRIDLAENVEHIDRARITTGQTKHYRDYYEHTPAIDGNGTTRNWTGCTMGSRGQQGSYCRIYDARKQTDKMAQAHKLARFGTTEFWRVEYELSRPCLRVMGYDTVDQMTPAVLQDIWHQEQRKKGYPVVDTTEYLQVRRRNNQATESDLADACRASLVIAMARKMQRPNLVALVAKLQDLVVG